MHNIYFQYNVIYCVDITVNDTAAEGTLRLVGGTTQTEGRVEIFLLGNWGTVCDISWDIVDATVVCHQLGYLEALGANTSAAFGAGSGPSWYRYVACAGNERKLTECSHSGYLGSACPHSQDAGVVCSSESKVMPTTSDGARNVAVKICNLEVDMYYNRVLPLHFSAFASNLPHHSYSE